MCDVIPGHIQSIAISDYFFLKQLTENVQVLNIRNNDLLPTCSHFLSSVKTTRG